MGHQDSRAHGPQWMSNWICADTLRNSLLGFAARPPACTACLLQLPRKLRTVHN